MHVQMCSMSAVEGTARAGGLLMCDVRNVFFLVQLPRIKKLNFTMPACIKSSGRQNFYPKYCWKLILHEA